MLIFAVLPDRFFRNSPHLIPDASSHPPGPDEMQYRLLKEPEELLQGGRHFAVFPVAGDDRRRCSWSAVVTVMSM
jgi:hypothetical protein